jgi:GNAT superfamily N-acetyltransferase
MTETAMPSPTSIDLEEAQPAGQSYRLHDGTPFTIRLLRPDDAPRLQALHSRLSSESIQMRFMAQLPALPTAEAQRLADVDGQTRVAFVASVEQDGEEAFLGVARYATLGPARPDQAEAAIVVEDKYQGQGVGTLLIKHLVAYARTHGVRWFLAQVSLENDRMTHFIRRTGLPQEMRLEDGEWQVRVEIAPEISTIVEN